MLSVFLALYIVAGIASLVIVSRRHCFSLSFCSFSHIFSCLLFLLFLFSLALSSCLIVLKCFIVMRRESCLYRLAHAAARGNLDGDLGDNFVPVNVSSHCISTRVSRTAGRQEPTFVSSNSEHENIYRTIEPHHLIPRK